MEKANILTRLSNLKKLLENFGINPVYFIIPLIFSFAAALFEGLSAGLLIPLVKGIIQMDFRFVLDLPVAKDVFAWLSANLGMTKFPVFFILVTAIFLAAVIKNVLQYASAVIVALQVRTLSYELRTHIFERYLSFGKMFFDRNNSGHLQNVLMGFTQRLALQLMMLQNFLNNALSMAIYLIIMSMISWKLTIVVFILGIILYHFLSEVFNLIKKLSANSTEWEKSLARKASNIISCMPLVKFYSQEAFEVKKFNQISSVVKNMEYKVDKKQSLVPAIHDMATLVVVLILASIMVFMVKKQNISEVSVFLVYFYFLKKSLTAFGLINSSISQFAAAQGQVREVRKIMDNKDKYFVHEGNKIFEGFKETIEFKNLNFSYEKSKPILNDISFSIKKGEVTAIVGPTGSGKTSLINILLRFYDCPESTVFIDGTDIRDFTLESLRACVALVSQESQLFDDTLRNNIIYGIDRLITDEVINEAVRKARLDNFVAGLPHKLETDIGERGVQLSGGEKQRVAIVRALLKNPQILILDEATSSLDSATEKLVQDAINEVIKGRTAIVIAHRLSTIKNADKIVAIEMGRITETGSLNELLKKKGKFYQYWEEQKFY